MRAFFGVKPVGVTGALWLMVLVGTLSPLLLVDIPAMGDYPNHLARMHLLTTQGNSFYQIHWGPFPNLAMDVVVPPLAHIMGTELATKAFLGISKLLIIGGATMLELVIKGRVQIAAFFALALLYASPFSWGFVNFEFGVGAALWGIAGWIALRQRPLWRAIFNLTAVPVLFFSHLAALGAYGVTIFTYECWRFWRGQITPIAAVGTLAVMCTPVVALMIMVLSSTQPLSDGGTLWVMSQKARALVHLFSGYSPWAASPLFGLFVWLVMANRQMLSWIAPGNWLAIMFLALFLALPMSLRGTSVVDARIPIAAALILPAFMAVDQPALNKLRIGLSVLALLSTAHVVSVWIPYQAQYRDIKASFAKMTKGSKVLVASGADEPPPDLWQFPIYHAPSLAVHYSDALVSSLFHNPGQQPIIVREDLRDAYPSVGGTIPISTLLGTGGWRSRFEYLYVVGSRESENSLPASLELLHSGELFALYQIKRVDTPSR